MLRSHDSLIVLQLILRLLMAITTNTTYLVARSNRETGSDTGAGRSVTRLIKII